MCILRDLFLIGSPLIRVNRGVQDVSLYTHVWSPCKAMLDPSKVYLSPSASYPVNAFWLSHLGVIDLEA